MKRKVEDIDIHDKNSVDQLVSQFGASGVFGAGRVKKAADILEDMINIGARIYLGLAGAMVPGGMRRVISDMIDDGMVHVLVSTGANITHDLMCSLGIPQWRDLRYESDAELRSKGISRIYDSFLDDGAFEEFESRIQPILGKCFESTGKDAIAPSELIHEIGGRLDDQHSIVASAYRRDVPVFVPAFTDSILGLQTFFYSQAHSIRLDVLADLKRIIDISYQEGPSGAILVGGGVPKNFILQSKLVAPGAFSRCIQITTDRPEPGGLSGATLEEAVSWGKLEVEAKSITVYGDATIILPIIVASVRERLSSGEPVER